ncbi:MAG TPA: DUF1501 domain-containing protein [Ideonella sp.]|uniref:DUF1501 domain-containing protein n=1 Tax=Ideonella sp. TaxID=1929293 RepID=UPI002E37188D|nr:DUF1501 domain-containing protein [Ideonella sp.]HEX5687182.1 DUF1501 domain-containing protein [Ideonella sp.]
MNRPLSNPTRRELLRRGAALGLAQPAISGLGGLGLSLAAMGPAAAANTSGYKALVCIFLTGGNDAYNTLLATDSASWSAYNAARETSVEGIALAAPGTPAQQSGSLHARLGGVLPISPINSQGRTLALHPTLGAVRDLFASQRLACISNVGPLCGPTTKTAFLAGTAPKPPKLFSHNDQQSVWQSFSAEGTTRGWGGLMADHVLSANSKSMFTSVSTGGNAVWLSGQGSRPYQMAPTGAIHIGGSDGTVYGSAAVRQRMVALMRTTRMNSVLQREHSSVVSRSVDADLLLSGALPGAGAGPWGTGGLAVGQPDPMLQFRDPETNTLMPNPLAAQLQAVARMVAARTALGMARQTFFVTLNGFDTHDLQPSRHTRLMAQLAHGLKYFDSVTTAMGVDDLVTTFTASDFGRTLAANGDGSDHGWGGHHFVMGGAVRGGDIYGKLPAYGVSDGKGGFNSADQVQGGSMLPTTSVEAYAATLGKWFGLSDSELLSVLPGLAAWNYGQRNLGFMAA